MLHLKYKFRTKTTLELVKLAQEGVKEAVNFVVERYYPMVVKISSKYYSEWAEKEDIIQNGLVGVLKAIYYYREDKSSFNSFVWKSIESEIKSFLTYLNRKKNKMLTDSMKVDFYSQQNEEDKMVDLGYKPEIFKEYITEEFLSECKRALSEEEFQVFEMYLQRFSYKEIAKHIGKKVKYVDNTLQRIKKKIEPLSEFYSFAQNFEELL